MRDNEKESDKETDKDGKERERGRGRRGGEEASGALSVCRTMLLPERINAIRVDHRSPWRWLSH